MDTKVGWETGPPTVGGHLPRAVFETDFWALILGPRSGFMELHCCTSPLDRHLLTRQEAICTRRRRPPDPAQPTHPQDLTALPPCNVPMPQTRYETTSYAQSTPHCFRTYCVQYPHPAVCYEHASFRRHHATHLAASHSDMKRRGLK
jgi:hypothetical protein